MTVRPISTASPTFKAMADTVAKQNARVVRVVCQDINRVVNDQGGKFKLRGAKGNRVPLEGKSDVKAFATQSQQTVVRGFVRGIPEGFWQIVEYGRGGDDDNYLVFSRTNRAGSTGQTKAGRAKRQFMSKNQAARRVAKGQSLGDLKPIRTPYGPRQYVRPGPHGPIGKPWETSMRLSQPLVLRDVAQIQGSALVREFLGG